MSILNNSNAIATGGGYFLDQSIRFRESASAYLRRTPATTSNRQTFTFSCWYKKSKSGIQHPLFYTQSGGEHAVRFRDDDDSLDWFYYSGGYVYRLRTSALYRDPSSWYHIVAVLNTTNGTASERARLYVNGERITAFQTASYPALNAQYAINTTVAHDIGHFSTSYNDGYMTEVNFVDGQALTASDFGEYNEDTGAWQPKSYAGTYGTNGFYLNMSTSGSTVLDQSTNSNNWTATNMNLTTSTATTYDKMTDVPTLTDEDTGNFATWNPLDKATLSVVDANLKATNSSGNSWQSIRGTIGVTEGKWYWEAEAVSSSFLRVGVALQSASLTSTYSNPNDSWTYVDTNGNKTGNGSETGYGASYTNGDTIGVALDMDSGTLTFYKNGVSQGVAFNTGLSGKEIFPLIAGYGSGKGFIVNFGQRPFKYTPPTGYKKLNTYNLPDSTIVDGSNHFYPKLYTGTGSTLTVSGLEFSPDWVWFKQRGKADYHQAYDTIRGVAKNLSPNQTTAEQNSTTVGLTAFNSNGFTIGTWNNLNQSGIATVAWCWRGSDSAPVSNTNGTVTSTVSANPTAGFSIVTWTGNGANATIGHGLGVKPAWYIVKRRDAGTSWCVYHEGMATAPQSAYMYLENSNSAVTGSGVFWNNTIPNTNTFGVSSHGDVNASGGTYVAYVFAPIEGFSKFGYYRGNGSSDGTFVHTGFRPAFLLTKRTDAGSNWVLTDAERSPDNESNETLYANLSNTEASMGKDLLSNGFKSKTTDADINGNGATYIYMAFAENPFKNALAR